MYSYCIACEQRYIYRDGDEDCTKFVCSWCMGTDPQKMLGKWSRLRFRILNRDKFTCGYCGDSPLKNNVCLLHIDHVKPQHEHGTNAEHNLITACAMCNLGKLGHELNDKAKEKVNEYLEEANKQLGEPYKDSQVVWNEQMENIKRSRGKLADSQYVGTGSLFPVTGETGDSKQNDSTKKK